MSAFLYQAPPMPVPSSRPKYREQREGLQGSNIMHDRRVVRGVTCRLGQTAPSVPWYRGMYAATVEQKQRLAKEKEEQEMKQQKLATQELQTLPYVEDFRQLTQTVVMPTQTDADMDRPAPPLFEPKSSGEDAWTLIHEGDLFDFDLNVEPILDVLIAKTLEESLQETHEEEELKQMRIHAEEFNQQRNAEQAELQRMQAADKRKEEEKARRLKEAIEKEAKRKEAAKAEMAKTLAKEFVFQIQDAVFRRLEASGFFYDPIERTVQRQFLPYLEEKVAEKMREYGRMESRLVDGLIADAVHTLLERSQHAEKNARCFASVEIARNPDKYPLPPALPPSTASSSSSSSASSASPSSLSSSSLSSASSSSSSSVSSSSSSSASSSSISESSS